MRLRVPLALSAAGLLAAVAALAAPPAAADPLDLATCAGTATYQFSPGVTNTPQNIQVTRDIDLGLCVTPLLASASNHVTAGLKCSNLLLATPGQLVLTWNNGQSSTFDYTTVFNTVNGVTSLIQSGSITSGRFAGSLAVLTMTGTTLDLTACDNEGLTSNTLAATLVITPNVS
ncbi:hypothetical protein ACN6LM_000787 [Streptomyces sp. SAS_281]|uniref:hypothetical protein n=1 Tax=Streptomyces sp. SAS_281 TaxID=3412744 RepID=UPI00403D155A